MQRQELDQRFSDPHIAKILQRLGHERENVRRDAERELFDLGPQSVDILLAHLNGLKRRRNIVLLNMLGRMVIAIGIMAFMEWFLKVMLGWNINVGIFAGLIGGFVCAGYQEYKRARRSATRVLTRLDDIRAVGALAEAMRSAEEKKARSDAAVALTRLLPRLQASDASLLNKRQRECLYRALGRDSRLTLAILKALEQIGDADALPYVDTMTHFYMPDVREAAIACLPYIQQRAEQERIRQTLLRPSNAVEATPKTLLRATTETSEVEPQQLLRPQIITDADSQLG